MKPVAYFAARFGVKWLLNENNMNDVNAKGRAPLHVAAKYGQHEIVKQLIDKGANIDAIDHNGMTPLHLAVFYTNLETVKILTDHGAQINVVDHTGRTIADFISIRYNRLSIDIEDVATYNAFVCRLVKIMEHFSSIETDALNAASELPLPEVENDEAMPPLLGSETMEGG